jgi:hypothetical protein
MPNIHRVAVCGLLFAAGLVGGGDEGNLPAPQRSAVLLGNYSNWLVSTATGGLLWLFQHHFVILISLSPYVRLVIDR